MLVSQIITKGLTPLRPETELQDVFPENYPEGITYAPVIENDSFIGFLSLSDLEAEQETHHKVADCFLEPIAHPIREDQHLFEVLPWFEKTGMPLLPVLDSELKYAGVLDIHRVSRYLSASYAFQTEGGTLVLSIPAIQYSLSELARLIEANQGKVLSVVLESDPVLNQNYLVHIKINQPDLSRIVATLERFEYNVLEVHQALEASSIDKDRFDQLMRYLGI